MLANLMPLQVPGGPELLIIAMILLPLLVLAIIGVLLIRRLMNLPDPSNVDELQREVVELREEVDALESRLEEEVADGSR